MIQLARESNLSVTYTFTPEGFLDPQIIATANLGQNCVEIKVKDEGRKIYKPIEKWFLFPRVKKSSLNEVEQKATAHLSPQTVVITVCSGKKKDVTAAKAIELYNSKRIDFVNRIVSEVGGFRFMILSAKYGLVASDELIHNYNKRLDDVNVDSMVDLVVNQLRRNRVISVVFFTAGTNDTYKTILEKAADLAGVESRIIGLPDMGGAKDLKPLLEILKKSPPTETKSLPTKLCAPVFSKEINGQLRFF